MNLVQVGVNKANDDFFQIVKNIEPRLINKILLVEPLTEFNDTIKECYKDYNFVLENIVINNDETKDNEMFFTSKYNWISSIKENHITKHGQDLIKSCDVLPALTLNKLFKKHYIQQIDVLFIDTEGMDDEIITSINFEHFVIKKIYYEHVHIDDTKLMNFLHEKNYTVTDPNFADKLTKLAIKQ